MTMAWGGLTPKVICFYQFLWCTEETECLRLDDLLVLGAYIAYGFQPYIPAKTNFTLICVYM